MFQFVPLSTINAAMDEIIASKVSVKARSAGQFLDQYKRHGKNLPDEWLLKRDNFIKRHMAQFKTNPTRRRQLALLVWGYKV